MKLTHLHKRKFGSFQIPYQNSIFCESLCNFLLLWPSYRDLLLLPRLEGELSQLWEMFEMKQCCSTKERKNKLLMFCFHCICSVVVNMYCWCIIYSLTSWYLLLHSIQQKSTTNEYNSLLILR